jgi:hypothetical protein
VLSRPSGIGRPGPSGCAQLHGKPYSCGLDDCPQTHCAQSRTYRSTGAAACSGISPWRFKTVGTWRHLGALSGEHTLDSRRLLSSFGELLVLCCHYHEHSWSESQIRRHLTDSSDVAILRGLAYAASYLWCNRDCQPIATEILCRLAVYSEVSVQRAVAAAFRVNQENLDLNLHMRRAIEAACTSPPVLLEAALSLVEILAPYTGTEPALVAKVCREVLKAAGPRISRVADSLSMLAETVTNIALTLHR